jgi:large subunit ribosomal protein L21
MKKYAVVKIAGLQYKVAEGDEVDVNNLNQEKGKELVLEDVLLLAEDDKIKIGQPFIKEAKIKAKVVEEFKGEKIRVATYKSKARFRKVKGFRPLLTKIKIEKIVTS